tara:strand:- start:500 stop:1999 length:1500 start_codon:yes stop_codon:yes gene_type:complete
MSDIAYVGKMFDILQNREKIKLAQTQLAQKAEEVNSINALKQIAQENKNNFTLTKENLHNRREENEVAIANLIKDIGAYNVVATEWSTLDDEWQTKDGKEQLKNMGVQYGEDFRLRETISTNAKEQLTNTANLIGLQDMIIDDLTRKKNQILDLSNDWLKVGMDAGFKNIKDSEDVKKYIKDNPQKFLKPSYTDEEGEYWTTPPEHGSGLPYNVFRKDEEGNQYLEKTTLADELNPLGKAFLKTKDTAADKGFAFTTLTAPQLKQAGLSTKEGTYGTPLTELEEKDAQLNVNTYFNSIKSTIGDIKNELADDPQAGQWYTEILDDLDMDNFMDLKGGQTMWDKNPDKLKEILEQKILLIFDHATTWSFLGQMEKPSTHDDVRKIAMLENNLHANPLNRYKGVSNLYERYVGGDTMVKGTDTYGNPINIPLPKEKVKGRPGRGGVGLLNQEYVDDVLYLRDRRPTLGETPEDKLVYELLSLWKVLDDYAPTHIPDILKKQ